VGTKLVLPGGKAHSKRRKVHSGKGKRGTVRKSTLPDDPPPDAQLTLVDPQGATTPAEARKLPTEAELIELAKAPKPADTASPAVAEAQLPPEAGNAGTSIKDRLLRVAQRMLAVPYRFGGTTLWGLDCSGFVQKTFAFLDLGLPRTAREQFREGAKVAKADLSPGDLVFFRTYAKYPSHVGIYLGDNRFVHASSRERKVTVESLDTPYYMKRYIGAKRLLFEQNDIEN
jgi:cell wall-associated NlpC family hydrolase